jgi:hypothetical protein
MLLKMMELENSEDYRYCPLSLLESVRAVVNALSAGRIDPFDHSASTLGPNGNVVVRGSREFRYAPSFVPKKHDPTSQTAQDMSKAYSSVDIAKFLGHVYRQQKSDREKPNDVAPTNITAALDCLYLMEVKAITKEDIKEMGWRQIFRFVADAKAERERTILRKVKTAEEIKKLNADALRIQAEQRDKEKKLADERAALVKKEAEAKREADAKKAKEIKERIAEKDAQAEKVVETFEAKKAAIEAKVEEVKQKQVAMKQEDVYLPIRREAIRIIHLLERRDEEEQVKALSRRELNANDRELIRQAAIARGTWYLDFVAAQFLPPLSTKPRIKKESK